MIISHLRKVISNEMKGSEVSNAFKQAIIGPEEGWEGYVMRVMTLKKGGFSPRHTHPWPHINYIITGKGSILLNGEETAVEAGSFAYIPSDAEHQFKNLGEDDFAFICIVPEEGDK